MILIDTLKEPLSWFPNDKQILWIGLGFVTFMVIWCIMIFRGSLKYVANRDKILKTLKEYSERLEILDTPERVEKLLLRFNETMNEADKLCPEDQKINNLAISILATAKGMGYVFKIYEWEATKERLLAEAKAKANKS